MASIWHMMSTSALYLSPAYEETDCSCGSATVEETFEAQETAVGNRLIACLLLVVLTQ